MAQDAELKLVEIRVQGMRTLADVRLPLDGLTVLIGDSGAGKSTLVEALELLHKVGTSSDIGGSTKDHTLRDAILLAAARSADRAIRGAILAHPDTHGSVGKLVGVLAGLYRRSDWYESQRSASPGTDRS